MEIFTKFITSGILLLLTLAFGFWLSSSGKPYNGLLFNIHKLIALGLVILSSIQIYRVLRVDEIQPLLILIIVLAVLCAAALFVSGALLSSGTPFESPMLTIHRIAPVLLTISLAVLIYLLSRQMV
jgi:hypothetical protein